MKCEQSYPGKWLSIGTGIGTAIGVATDQLAVGVGLGAAIGLMLSFLFSRMKKSE
jgi:hypothetical protein